MDCARESGKARPSLRKGGALALRLSLHHVQCPIRYRRGVVLALQVVGDRIAGNVGRSRVVLNLQVAADLVVVDRQRSVIVAGLEIVADRVAGTGICIVRADFDRAAIILNYQIALDHRPTEGALRLASRERLDMQIVADRGSINAEGTAARNCNIAIHGASKVEAATVHRDVPFALARARKYAILSGRYRNIAVEDAVVITIAALPGGESDGYNKGADGI